MHTGVESPKGVWWKPAHKSEKVWVWVAFVWCMILFAMMPLWHWKGGQNPSGIRARVEPAAFQARTMEFIEQYQVGVDNGIPVVEPPPGSDIYMYGRMWAWEPVLKLKTNTEYVLHLSSLDLNHGFNLYPLNINFQIVPGYDYGLRITTSEAGDYRVICNEFCGVGHHLMVGRVIVEDATAPLALEPDGAAGATDENADGASPDVYEVKPMVVNEGGDR